MSKDKLIVFIFLFLISSNDNIAQNNYSTNSVGLTIPAIAILNIATESPVSFSSPAQSNVVITPESTSNSWINYSSIIACGTSNKITVNISSENLAESTSIKLIARADAGRGAGNVGTPTNEIILSEIPQNIISTIGSCYTGKGTQKGHQLIYTWIVDEECRYNEIERQNTVSLTYTILSSN
ncbi:MAG: hypothetical protein HN704_04950 [Bacteroidetes bacterium]|jgi:hypothetical protein|nr:hypothetical protein [Bacteroidota bacterium]MBT7143553.1 hypothetical protein [Bacteroidota bacterium]MBT7490940.1 hypothetical protein [Bacteroidota bacterium]